MNKYSFNMNIQLEKVLHSPVFIHFEKQVIIIEKFIKNQQNFCQSFYGHCNKKTLHYIRKL